MVKILSNGEIVDDNDPRLCTANSEQRVDRHIENDQNSWRLNFGTPVPEGAEGQAGIGVPANQRSEGVTLFDLMNDKLLEAGIPRLQLGAYDVEPIAAVGTCLALLLFGLNGLILSLVLFLVVKFSRHGIPSLNDFFVGQRGQATNAESQESTRHNINKSSSRQRANTNLRHGAELDSKPKDKWGTGMRLGGH